MLICGIDEAGRGPLAGPVVASAVILDKGCFIEGVADSKLLTEEEREDLFGQILDKCVSYSVSIVGNSVIDEINILRATMKAMEESLDRLSKKPDKIYIDGNYFRLDNEREKTFNYETVVKGDSKIFAISCASIIAKVTRDRIMKDLHEVHPLYNFSSHKGYATKEHIENIREHGLCEIHRASFCRRIFEYNYKLDFDE
ncbi:MAG: ribonuclease HII [Ignavibacteriae bacterium]|nr:ribonuclease HII [Ignavibacteriota bacterium]MCB9243404.1 ribonuclease HII [Ignavibacteriales bacterium]